MNCQICNKQVDKTTVEHFSVGVNGKYNNMHICRSCCSSLVDKIILVLECMKNPHENGGIGCKLYPSILN